MSEHGDGILAGKEPALLWKHFEAVSGIPRCSKHEEKIREHLREFAISRKLEVAEDKVGNIVIRKPGSTGMENAPWVILQSHMDMVCEKNTEVEHDFSKDPIKLDLRGEWLYARGTSLGADDGIGVATSLAILESDDVKHGPLEALFTVDEETGLTGAFGIELDMLKGRIMLNLDSEEWGTIYVGCAGGGDAKLMAKYPPQTPPTGWKCITLTLKGLKGGHSGVDIHQQRGNAVKLLARMLWALAKDGELRLASLNGGDKHNAIPREANAKVFLDDKTFSDLNKMVKEFGNALKVEYGSVEPGLLLSFSETTEEAGGVLGKEHTILVLSMLNALPHGVVRYSNDIEGLVETSSNLASAKVSGGEVQVHTSSRSSISSALEAVRDSIEAIGHMAGASVEREDSYPGWKPNLDSAILKLAKEAFVEMYGKEPGIKAIHAGLETGVLGERFPGMDMISIGPQIEHPHSPDERVHVESCKHFWDYVCDILGRVAGGKGREGM
ncbi:MAG: aminoacyl-histidine dipeptidase [Candidatus Thermoplasmatota archaeon]|nr:aminoacyl-histidine dipeptidase [Candidatus Thermoplasmatota archaeon]